MLTTIILILAGVLAIAASIVAFILIKCNQEAQDEGLLEDLGKWPKGSWPFFLIDDGTMEEFTPYFREGVKFWNDTIGIKLFTFDLLFSKAQTVPILKGSLLGNKVMKVEFTLNIKGGELVKDENDDPIIKSAHIIIDQEKLEYLELSPETLKRAARHELGHVLRLAHDKKAKLSVMYPDLSPTETPTVTAKDRQLLKDLYG